MAYKPKVLAVADGGTSISSIGNSQLFATNAAGTVAGRSFSVVRQVFTTPGAGTYTPTTGMLYCDIICIGGGGAGGGSPTTGASQTSVGGGGGAGEYAQGLFTAAQIGVSKALSIGAAGTPNSGATGGNGGNSSVGATLISANGGSGGVAGVAGAGSSGAGGAGGTGGTGGDFRNPGQQGTSGSTNFGVFFLSGAGARSNYGNAGISIIGASSGAAAAGYGSGGGGSALNQNTSANSGGAGTAGIIIITEYVIN